jgi:hypothetical protein
MRASICATMLCFLFAIVLWEKLETYDLYTRPLSSHWFNTTCAWAADRWKAERPWTSDLSLALMQDSHGLYRLGAPPYKVIYECWPDTIDPRVPKAR